MCIYSEAGRGNNCPIRLCKGLTHTDAQIYINLARHVPHNVTLKMAHTFLGRTFSIVKKDAIVIIIVHIFKVNYWSNSLSF